MAFFCVVVITGNLKPSVVEVTSTMALDAGVPVPMPIRPALVMRIRSVPEVVPAVIETAVGTVPAETAPSTKPVMAPNAWFDVPSEPKNTTDPRVSPLCTAVVDVAVVPRVLSNRRLAPVVVSENARCKMFCAPVDASP